MNNSAFMLERVAMPVGVVGKFNVRCPSRVADERLRWWGVMPLDMDDLKLYAEQMRIQQPTAGYDLATLEKQRAAEATLCS